MGDAFSILQVALGIGFLIFIHELGHFLAARAAGVRVETFSLGMGPRVFGFRRGATYYQIAAVPVGGYVRVAGEDPHPRHVPAPDELHAKSVGARAAFYFGGVWMNLLFAFIAFPLVFYNGVKFPAPVVGSVVPGGAAWHAGLLAGDEIVSIDGKETYSFNTVAVEAALASDRDISVHVRRGDSEFDVQLRPLYSESRGAYELGIRPALADEPPTIREVDGDGPAFTAGIRDDDVLVGINGEREAGKPLEDAFFAIETGDTVQLVVRRGDDEREVSVVAGEEVSTSLRLGVRGTERRILAVRPAAQSAGFRPGDLLTSLDGEPFWLASEAQRLTENTGEITAVVKRDGQSTPIRVAAPTPTLRQEILDGLAFEPEGGQPIVVPQEDSPAMAAGIQPGDVIIGLNGQRIDDWDALRSAVGDSRKAPINVRVRRGTSETDLVIHPEYIRVVDLGFQPQFQQLERTFQNSSIGGALEAGFVASVDLVKQLYVTLKRLFTGDVATKNLGGIVTISRVSYQFAQAGWMEFIYFLALLSINLAFINVLPIPVLDGGHLMFLLIEKIKGSPVSTRVMNYSQILGLVFVVALMVFVTYNDILRLISS